MEILGRSKEIKLLQGILGSNRAEFLAVYGRRRVGKTFLIRNFFPRKNVIFLSITGTKNAPLSDQIDHFLKEIGRRVYNGASLAPCNNWDLAFEHLTNALEIIPHSKKIVLFLDEFPWMATKNSKLLQTLDYYWNQYWSQNPRIKLIICGSSASWIIEKIINNKGGLHNRLTHTLCLEPFRLPETKEFIKSLGLRLNNAQILELYMALGGIPYYLSRLEKGLSATQNIDQLAFQKNGFLFTEFENLFSALFDEHDIYLDIIRFIGTFRYGANQEDILQHLGKKYEGKSGLQKLKNLQEAHFISCFRSHFHKRKGIYYRIIDEYTLFYLNWIEPIQNTLLSQSFVQGYWEQQRNKASYFNWAGYAFESICYKHINQIVNNLGLSPSAIPNIWKYVPQKGSKDMGAQIDLLFDRDDNAITLCEIKYTQKPYIIDKAEAQNLSQKIQVFQEVTRTKKQIFLCMISANGLQKTLYSEKLVDAVVTLDDLFTQ